MSRKRPRTYYVCSQCGERSLKWFGRCPSCEGWNTLVEETDSRSGIGSSKSPSTPPKIVSLSEAASNYNQRRPIGTAEIDRVLGGGVVPGSLILLGGEPGVGKSTLLLQVASGYAARHGVVLYVTGEESASQVARRAGRLGITDEGIRILSETRIEVIEEAILAEKPDLVVIDSIQTMIHPDIDSGPGSVAQVRECCHHIGRIAKGEEISTFVVGHVNKQGALAGPKVLEHAVDVVLNFEGERQTSYRQLRASKNRYGSTHEVGIFAMGEKGLSAVENPSERFLAERPKGSPGSVVIASREGTRPVLVEIQSLVGPTAFGGTPRRQVAGVDYHRVSIVLAVLEKRIGIPLQTQDVYVNVAGGLKVVEPACDLGVAVAVASSHEGTAPDEGCVVFGEVGLAGEVRSVPYGRERLLEAARMGFRRAVVPSLGDEDSKGKVEGIETIRVKSVEDALKAALGA